MLKKQEIFFKVPIEMGKFFAVDYHKGISTTQIINNIKKNY